MVSSATSAEEERGVDIEEAEEEERDMKVAVVDVEAAVIMIEKTITVEAEEAVADTMIEKTRDMVDGVVVDIETTRDMVDVMVRVVDIEEVVEVAATEEVTVEDTREGEEVDVEDIKMMITTTDATTGTATPTSNPLPFYRDQNLVGSRLHRHYWQREHVLLIHSPRHNLLALFCW